MRLQTSLSKNGETRINRRDFMKMGLGALSTLAVLEVGGAGLLFLQPRQVAGEFGSLVSAGTVESFAPGSVTEFPGARFYLVRAADGGFLALYNRCTHLGCSVKWEAGAEQFFCPCHASSFDTHGDVQNAPAPRPLDIFPISIAEGQVLVDTGHVRTRDLFTTDHLVYA